MRLSIGKSCYDRKWRVMDMAWDALVAKLGTCQRTHESMSEYRAMTQEERSRVKDVGGFVGGVLMTDGKPGGRRSNANIADRCLLTLDADEARKDDWEWVCAMENWSLCAYSTHSHTPEKPKLRWVLPMTRTVTPDEYECLARTVAQRINIESMDVSTYQPARLMYWPSCPVDAAPFFAVRNGPVLDPDALLRETYGEGEAWRDRSLWPVSSKEVRLIEHSQKRAGEPTEKPGIIGLFCRTYDVPRAIDAFLPDVYDECGTTGRYTYTKGSTGGGAVLYDNGALIYSHHSTDPATGRCLNAFDLVRIHKFGQLDWDAPEGVEVTQLPSYKAMSDFAAALEEVRIQQAAETAERTRADFSDLALAGGGSVLEVNEDGTLDDMSWASQLELTRKGAPECTIGNALLYLTHDKGLAGAIAYNEFSCRKVKRRLMPWETGMLTETRAGEADSVDGRGWTDTDDAALRLYMEKLGITGSRIIDDALMVAAKKNAFHPVREYLTRLTWDGVERLDTMLIRWMGAEDSPYVRAVTRKWLTAGVARVMRPGCKFDNMLILVGPQGIGKSRLAGALARRWFLDGLPDFTSKDTLERIQGKWIVEVAELSAMRKSEVEDVKGFISRTTDTFRVAYGRNSGDFPRQSIVLDKTATEIKAVSAINAEEVQTQAALLNRVFDGTIITEDDLADLNVTDPGVQYVFTKNTGVVVDKSIRSNEQAVRKLFQETSVKQAEIKGQQSALKEAQNVIVEAQTERAGQTAQMTAPVEAQAEIAVPAGNEAGEVTSAQGSAQAATAAASGPTPVVNKVEQIVTYADGTTATQSEYVADYRARHPGSTKSDANKAFYEAKNLNAAMHMAIPGSAKDLINPNAPDIINNSTSENADTTQNPGAKTAAKAKSAPGKAVKLTQAEKSKAAMAKADGIMGVKRASSKELGLPGGAADDVVFVLRDDKMSAEHKALVKKYQDKKVKKVILTTSPLHDAAGHEVRGHALLSANGETMWINVNSPSATGEQIAAHEYGHIVFGRLRRMFGGGKANGQQEGSADIHQPALPGGEQSVGGNAGGDTGIGGESVGGTSSTAGAQGGTGKTVDEFIADFLDKQLTPEQYGAIFASYRAKYGDNPAVVNEEIFCDALGDLDSYGGQAGTLLHDAAMKFSVGLEKFASSGAEKKVAPNKFSYEETRTRDMYGRKLTSGMAEYMDDSVIREGWSRDGALRPMYRAVGWGVENPHNANGTISFWTDSAPVARTYKHGQAKQGAGAKVVANRGQEALGVTRRSAKQQIDELMNKMWSVTYKQQAELVDQILGIVRQEQQYADDIYRLNRYHDVVPKTMPEDVNSAIDFLGTRRVVAADVKEYTETQLVESLFRPAVLSAQTRLRDVLSDLATIQNAKSSETEQEIYAAIFAPTAVEGADETETLYAASARVLNALESLKTLYTDKAFAALVSGDAAQNGLAGKNGQRLIDELVALRQAVYNVRHDDGAFYSAKDRTAYSAADLVDLAQSVWKNVSREKPIYECFLNVKHPYVVDAKGETYYKLHDQYGSRASTIAREIYYHHQDEYDGVVVMNVRDTMLQGMLPNKLDLSNTVITFNAEQAKSTANTSPTEDWRAAYSYEDEGQPWYDKLSGESKNMLSLLDSGMNNFSTDQELVDAINALPEVIHAKSESAKKTGNGARSSKDIHTPKEEASREELKARFIDGNMSGSWTGKGYVGKEKIYTGPVDHDRKAFFVFGPPAAGKSTSTADVLSMRYHAYVSDLDAFVERHKDYDNGRGNDYVGRDCKDMQRAVEEMKRAEGANLVVPKVGDNMTSVARKEMKELHDAGYTIYVGYVGLNKYKGLARNLKRYFKGGRFIGPEYPLLNVGDNPKNNFGLIKEIWGEYNGQSRNRQLEEVEHRYTAEGSVARGAGTGTPGVSLYNENISEGPGLHGAVGGGLGGHVLGLQGELKRLLTEVLTPENFGGVFELDNDVAWGEEPRLLYESEPGLSGSAEWRAMQRAIEREAKTSTEKVEENNEGISENQSGTSGEGNSRGARYGDDLRGRNQGGPNNAEDPAGVRYQGEASRSLRGSDNALVLIPAKTRALMDERGFTNAGLAPTQNAEAFSAALQSAKNANSRGQSVDGHSAAELGDHKMFLSDDGTTGVAVGKDGNITAVFSDPKSGRRGVINDLILTAVQNGGDKLDCYVTYSPRDLLNKYTTLGFEPVAWMRFNRDYAAPDWNYDLMPDPDVVFFMHNGNGVADVIANIDTVHIPTADEVHALPEFTDYDEAWNYRDNLLAARKLARDKSDATPEQMEQLSKHSLEDNLGTKLPDAVAEFFADTHMRAGGNYETNTTGPLKRMYHGVDHAFGRTVLIGKAKAGYTAPCIFFTDSVAVAESYGFSDEQPRSLAKKTKMQSWANKLQRTDTLLQEYNMMKQLGMMDFSADDEAYYADLAVKRKEYYAQYTKAKGQYEASSEGVKVADGIPRYEQKGVYEAYLNITNPLVIDGHGDIWTNLDVQLGDYYNRDGMTPRDIAEYAYTHGYDGVIIKNVVDPGGYNYGDNLRPQTEAIVFKSNQFKAINNKKPTESPDYRSSYEETGYPTGSIQDKVLTVLNSTDEKTAIAELEKWFNEMQTQQSGADLTEEEKPLFARVFQPAIPAAEKAENAVRAEDLIKQYGALPEGEKKSRNVAFPQQKSDSERISKHMQTAAEAGITPENAVPFITKTALKDGAATYARIHDTSAIKYADDTMRRRGYAKLLEEWSGISSAEHSPTKNDIAVGELLWLEAAKVGDMDTAMRVLTDVAAMGTQSGQVVQAMSLLKKMTPSGQLYYLQKALDRLNKDYRKRIDAGKMKAISLDPELARQVLEAGTKEELDAAMDALLADVAAQTPVTLMDKWNTWRYLAMLGNPRTHIRNLFGNTIFAPVRFMKDLLASGMEAATLSADQRTKNAAQLFGANKELTDFAKTDFEEIKDSITNSGKYNPSDVIRDKRVIFKSKLFGWVNTASKFNNYALEWEDAQALKPAYTSALSQYLAARGADIATLRSTKDGKKLLEEARAYAIHEAQKATYRDFSATAVALNRLKKLPVTGVLLEGLLPFTKTPLNILKRGVEYSPVGLLETLTVGTAQLKSGRITGAEFIDKLAAGMTGTMITALGMLLSRLDLLHGGDDEDDKQAAMDELQGYQNYSIQIGNVNYTIDWMAPVALPLFVGAEMYRMLSGDQDLTAAEFADALTLVAEPMFSLSMLDGLNRTLTSAGYDENPLSAVLVNMLTSYLGQGFPTLGGQIARTIDRDRHVNYIDKNSSRPATLDRFIQGSVMSKIPGLNSQRAEYIDEWGRTDTTQSAMLRAFENFLSPGYINLVKTTTVDSELQRLADVTSNTDVLPAAPAKYFTVNNARKDLTADEYVAYSQTRGQRAYELMSELINGAAYQSMTDEAKAIAVANVYEYATQTAKHDLVPEYKTDAWISAARDMTGASVADAIVLRTLGKVDPENDTTKSVVGMTWLTDEDKGALLASGYYADKSFTDPRRSGYEYALDTTQQTREVEIYNELFEKAYDRLVSTGRWERANADARAELIDTLQTDVRADTREQMSRELKSNGVKSTKKD